MSEATRVHSVHALYILDLFHPRFLEDPGLRLLSRRASVSAQLFSNANHIPSRSFRDLFL